MVTTKTEKAPELTPRGTDRVRRRAAQTAHKVAADAEAAVLTSPTTPEKLERIAAQKQEQVARFGGNTSRARRTTLQHENRRKVEAEAVQIASVQQAQAPELPAAGQPVDLLTARRVAKSQDRVERDDNKIAARAAGEAVYETLKGRPQRNRHTRQRRIAQHNARQARLNAASAAAAQ